MLCNPLIPFVTPARINEVILAAMLLLIRWSKVRVLGARRRFCGPDRRRPACRTVAAVDLAGHRSTREEVDQLVKKAVAAGGSPAMEPQDHGFMYGWSFYDPDDVDGKDMIARCRCGPPREEVACS